MSHSPGVRYAGGALPCCCTVGHFHTTAIVHNLGGKRRTSYSCFGFSTSTIKSQKIITFSHSGQQYRGVLARDVFSTILALELHNH